MPHKALRLARPVTIPARTEMFVPVQGTVKGLYMITSYAHLLLRHQCAVANGVADIRSSVMLYDKVDKLADHDVRLRKGMQIAPVIRASSVNPIVEVNRTEVVSDREGVGAISPSGVPQSQKERRAYEQLSTKRERKPNIIDVNDIPLSDITGDE